MLGWSWVRPILAGVVVAAVIAVGLYTVLRRGTPETLITIVAATPANGGMMTVFVGGAVVNPGVYTLAYGERVEGAIAAAGGLSPEADPDGINRATKLRDEGQVIVPRKGQPTATVNRTPVAINGGAPISSPAPSGTRAPTATALPVLIDLNSAGVTDLARLPGVGPKLAQDIVDYRNAHGPFKTVLELANVKGISERMVVGWGELVFVGP